MAEFVDELKNRVSRYEKELHDINLKLDQFTHERNRVFRLLKSCNELLAGEPGGTVSVDQKPHSIGKTAFIRQEVKESKGSGITPSQIYKDFTDNGVQLHRNYIYSVLRRLVSSNEVRKSGKRYFSVEENSGGLLNLEGN